MTGWTSRSRPTRSRCATRSARSSRPRRRRNTSAGWPSTTTPASRPRCGDAIVDLGWTGLLVPEAHGGLGLGHHRRRRRAGGDGARDLPRSVSSRPRSSRHSRRARSASTTDSPRWPPDTSGARSRSTKPGTAIRSNAIRVRATAAASRHKLDGVKPMVMDGAIGRLGARPRPHARRAADVSRRGLGRARAARAVARHHPQVRPVRVRPRRARCSSVRPAITRNSGAASPTTRRCCSRPS